MGSSQVMNTKGSDFNSGSRIKSILAILLLKNQFKLYITTDTVIS